jgi:hypothetical protein
MPKIQLQGLVSRRGSCSLLRQRLILCPSTEEARRGNSACTFSPRTGPFGAMYGMPGVKVRTHSGRPMLATTRRRRRLKRLFMNGESTPPAAAATACECDPSTGRSLSPRMAASTASVPGLGVRGAGGKHPVVYEHRGKFRQRINGGPRGSHRPAAGARSP